MTKDKWTPFGRNNFLIGFRFMSLSQDKGCTQSSSLSLFIATKTRNLLVMRRRDNLKCPLNITGQFYLYFIDSNFTECLLSSFVTNRKCYHLFVQRVAGWVPCRKSQKCRMAPVASYKLCRLALVPTYCRTAPRYYTIV